MLICNKEWLNILTCKITLNWHQNCKNATRKQQYSKFCTMQMTYWCIEKIVAAKTSLGMRKLDFEVQSYGQMKAWLSQKCSLKKLNEQFLLKN